MSARQVNDSDFQSQVLDSQRPVLVDFYADWCVSCIEMEEYTFTDPGVQAALANTVVLQADVTANDELDQELLQRFGVFGPPTIIFFGADGEQPLVERYVQRTQCVWTDDAVGGEPGAALEAFHGFGEVLVVHMHGCGDQLRTIHVVNQGGTYLVTGVRQNLAARFLLDQFPCQPSLFGGHAFKEACDFSRMEIAKRIA